MIDEFNSWKEKQDPFTDDIEFFNTKYQDRIEFSKAIFKEIYRLSDNQKLLANAVAHLIEDSDDGDD